MPIIVPNPSAIEPNKSGIEPNLSAIEPNKSGIEPNLEPYEPNVNNIEDVGKDAYCLLKMIEHRDGAREKRVELLKKAIEFLVVSC